MATRKNRTQDPEMFPGCGFSRKELVEDFRRNWSKYRVRKIFWVYRNNVFALTLETLAYVSRKSTAIFLASAPDLSVKQIFVLRRGCFFCRLDHDLQDFSRKVKQSCQEAEYEELMNGLAAGGGLQGGKKEGEL